jgi:predicted permease
LIGSSLDRNLDEEMRFHIEQRIAEQLRHGLSPDEARRVVMRRFGNSSRVKELTRDADTLRWLAAFVADVRYSIRFLRRSPGFAAAVVATLALGIAANATIGSVVDALMLTRLPVRNPDELVTFGSFPIAWLAPFQERVDVFSGVVGVSTHSRSDLTATAGGNADAQVQVALVTAGYFEVMGVRSAVGRGLLLDDHASPGAGNVAVLSDRYWRTRFSRAQDIVGRPLTLGGTTYTIVGVMPPGFNGEVVGQPVDLWVPDTMTAQIFPELNIPAGRDPRAMLTFRFIARLRAGMAVSQAQAAGDEIYRRLLTGQSGSSVSPQTAAKVARKRLSIEAMARGVSPQRRSFGRSLTILMGLAAIFLAIACANVANLLLARTIVRQREMAVRLALGAHRTRLVTQLLTEAVMLAIAGGALGFLLAWWGTGAVGALMRSGGSVAFNAAPWSLDLDLRPNLRLLGFTASLCLVTAVVTGMIPVFLGGKPSLDTVLRHRPTDEVGGRGPFRFGRLLVVAQIALALPLLIGGIVFARSLYQLQAQDMGIDREHVLMVWTSTMQSGRRPGPSTASLFEAAQARLQALPGVMASSASVYGLLNGNSIAGAVIKRPGDMPAPETALAGLDIVMPRYFESLGMRVVRGRDFTSRDTEQTSRVVIINEALARRVFQGADPLGQRIGFGTQATGNEYEIVGVVNDSAAITPYDPHRLMYFKPYRQDIAHLLQMVIVVRTAANTPELRSRIRDELRSLDSRLPVLRIGTADEQLEHLLVGERISATVSACCGLLAAILTGIGLYGVVAYLTVRRRTEIGIRMAVGASRTSVVTSVIRQSLVLAVIGVALGVALTFAAARLVAAQFAGLVMPLDSLTVGGAAAFVVTLAFVAGAVPAYRASLTDPAVTLREQ